VISVAEQRDDRHRVYVENLGCAKNQVDAEVMLAALEENGAWERTAEADEADLIIINTCGFIEPAREESLNTLFALRAAWPKKKIIMAGCLAERYGRQISAELHEADGFFGNLDLGRIPGFAARIMAGERAELYPELPEREYITRRGLLSYPGSAYLKISEGCSHHCSYCAIPLIRGELRSRPFEDVLGDARRLISSGVREINIIAQDLAAYGRDRSRRSEFPELLSRLSSLEGSFVLRMLYIHPDSFPGELIRLVKERENILPYFDIPFQHAAQPILRAMGRSGTYESYLDLIESIRAELPDAVIRSTFMLGFPGERASHVARLMHFAEAARLDWAGVFIYSPEEGTPAFGLRSPAGHRAAAKRSESRRQELEALQQSVTEEPLKRWIGREFDVLIEERVAGEELLIGRMFAQAPEVDGSTVVLSDRGEPGQIIRCGIRRTVGVDLEAVPVG
jgi:ribosomal protein S12 methylthiotransferase